LGYGELRFRDAGAGHPDLPDFAALTMRLLLLVTLLGQLYAQSSPEHLLREAIQLHQQGDLSAAIPKYEAFLKERPDVMEVRSNLGAAYARAGRYEDAIAQYREALKLSPEQSQIRLNLALAYYKQARMDEAIAELERLRAAQPDNAQVMLLLADCYLRLGEDRKVISTLDPVAAKHPDDKGVAYLLGTALVRSGDLERGQRVIDRILKQGESAEAQLLIGTAQLVAGDFKGSLATLTRASELNPKLPSVHAFLGQALVNNGEPERAKEAFRKELEINADDFEANLHLGALLRTEKQMDEAEVLLTKVQRMRPRSLAVMYQIGSLRLAQGKPDEARGHLEQVVKESPRFLEAHVALATVYYRLKRKEDGDRERAIVDQINAENQKKELEKR
jgi:tetratricopeptide (TPR) repeat protein